MLINYQNLTIRNAVASDAELLTNWWNDGKVMAHAGFPNGLGTTVERTIRELSGDTDEMHRVLIIEVEGKPVGEMNYRNKGDNIAEIGIKICDFDKQEKGNGTLFLKILINELFSIGYKKIILDTNLLNLRAQHVYKKIGFKKIRVNYDSWKNQLGELQSSIDYELVESDFIGIEN